MSRRLEVELTSKRADGAYTWRAVGAKQPKGELDGALLYDGADVGDVVRVEADFAIDGVYITSVMPPKTKRSMPETLELLVDTRSEGGVTTHLVGKGGRGRSRRDDDGRADRSKRSPRGDRKGSGKRDGRKPTSGRGEGKRRDDRGRRPERSRRERPAAPARPRAKRLRSRRVHRDAALKEVPDIQRPLARVVLRDGLPGLRRTIESQNEKARERSQPEIPPQILEAVGERLLPGLRSAEWRDNAEAALEGIVQIDLRDIRKVVVAAETGARGESDKALAQQLADGLTARVEAEHGKWLSELSNLLAEGRTVRALRQSSRPPKAGAPLPTDLANRLSEAASSSMTEDTLAERWATVLDAVAFSPVRQHVRPQGLPTKITPELRATVKKLSKRVPDIAALFEKASPAPIPPPPTADSA